MYFLSYLPAYLCILLLNKFIYLLDIFILQYPVDFLGDFKFLWKFTFFKFFFGAGEIDYQVRELTILPKGPSSIPSAYMVAYSLLCLWFQGYHALSWPLWAPGIHAGIHISKTLIYKIIINTKYPRYSECFLDHLLRSVIFFLLPFYISVFSRMPVIAYKNTLKAIGSFPC